MRNVIASLALLVAGQAAAQGLTPLAPGQTGGGKVLWSAPFATVGCLPSGQTGGASSAISTTRASTATYVNAGTLYTCQNNEARITSDGLLVEPARTNIVQYSDSPGSTGWTTFWALGSTAPSITTGQSDPAGGTKAVKLKLNGPGSGVYQSVTTASANVSTLYVRADSPTNVYLWLEDGSGANCQYVLCSAGTTWSRCQLPGGVRSVIAIGNNYPACSGQADLGNPTFYAYGAQNEAGTYPTSYIPTPTTGGTYERKADQVSATVPAGWYSGGKWCVAGTFKPENNRDWADSNLPMGWGFGNTNLGNSAFLYSTGAANVAQVRVNDSSNNNQDTKITTSALNGGAASRLVFCNSSGNPSLVLNGSVASSGHTGAGGTGLWASEPSSISIGSRQPFSSAEAFGGSIKNLSLWKASKPKEVK